MVVERRMAVQVLAVCGCPNPPLSATSWTRKNSLDQKSQVNSLKKRGYAFGVDFLGRVEVLLGGVRVVEVVS